MGSTTTFVELSDNHPVSESHLFLHQAYRSATVSEDILSETARACISGSVVFAFSAFGFPSPRPALPFISRVSWCLTLSHRNAHQRTRWAPCLSLHVKRFPTLKSPDLVTSPRHVTLSRHLVTSRVACDQQNLQRQRSIFPASSYSPHHCMPLRQRIGLEEQRTERNASKELVPEAAAQSPVEPGAIGVYGNKAERKQRE